MRDYGIKVRYSIEKDVWEAGVVWDPDSKHSFLSSFTSEGSTRDEAIKGARKDILWLTEHRAKEASFGAWEQVA